MTTITWIIQGMRRNAEDDLVTTVDWIVTAAKDDFIERAVGSVTVERGEEFVEFENLTQETVIGWVKDKIGEEVIAAIEADLINKVEKLAAPTTIYGTPSSWSEIPVEPTV